MKKISTIFLQAVIILIGLGAFAWLLVEPQLEGVNANATSLSEIYLDDPFLAYVYLASIAFFTAVYQTFKVLGYVRQNKTFSPVTAKALQTIKYCALILIAFFIPPVAYLFIVRPGDDIAGGVAMGLFIIFVSTVVAAKASVLEGIVRDKA